MTRFIKTVWAFAALFLCVSVSVQSADKVPVKLANGVETPCDVVKVTANGAVLKANGREVTLPLEKMDIKEVLACHNAVASSASAQTRFDMGSYFLKKQQWNQAETDLSAAAKLDAALKPKVDPLLQTIALIKGVAKDGDVTIVEPGKRGGMTGGKEPGKSSSSGSSGDDEGIPGADDEDFEKKFLRREVPPRAPAEMKKFLDDRLAELKKVIGGEWRMIETAHFYCFFNGTPAKHQTIAGWNEFLYQRLASVLKHKEGEKLWNNKMPIYYFAKYGEFQRFAAEIDKSPGAAYSGGYFMSRGREVHICIPFMTERLNSEKQADRMARSTLHHEGTHAFLQLTGEDVPLSRWLHEGMAQFIEFLYDGLEDPNGRGNSRERKDRADFLGTAVKRGGIPGWEAMKQRPMGGTDIEGYAFAWSKFEFFYRNFPPAQVPVFVKAIKSGKSEEEAMKEAYKLAPEKLEDMYKAWLREKTKGGFFKLD